MQANGAVVEIPDDDTDMDSVEDDTTNALLHAKTLRLDDTHVETNQHAPTDDAAVWQNKYNELLARLEKLEGGKKPEDSFTTPTPKRHLQTPASSESLCPSPSPLPPAPPQLEALPASGPPVVPKGAAPMPCPPKAPAVGVAKAPAVTVTVAKAPAASVAKAPAASVAAAPAVTMTLAKAPAASVAEAPAASEEAPAEAPGLHAGEEELAEEMDLDHEDRAKVAFTLIAFWKRKFS